MKNGEPLRPHPLSDESGAKKPPLRPHPFTDDEESDSLHPHPLADTEKEDDGFSRHPLAD